MAFDYSKLRGRIVEHKLTETDFANAIGISPQSLSAKLNNKSFFDQVEMERAKQVLGFSEDEICVLFFSPLVKEA